MASIPENIPLRLVDARISTDLLRRLAHQEVAIRHLTSVRPTFPIDHLLTEQSIERFDADGLGDAHRDVSVWMPLSATAELLQAPSNHPPIRRRRD